MPKQVSFTFTQPEDSNAVITVFVKGEKPVVADDTHPNFQAILEGALADDPSVLELWDIGDTVAKRFKSLSEQVSVANGHVYFDGDEVDNSLTEQILRFLDEGLDFTPLVLFFEKVRSNPNEDSREMLYEFLRSRDFTITDEGDFVAYKGVRSDGNGGFTSLHSGKARVDDVEVNGLVPYAVDSVVEMPRSEVVHDPNSHCSYGLHVGTFDYASSYSSGGAMLEVHVNPRDVVSVPNDSSGEKMRVCRLYVADTLTAPLGSALRTTRVVEDYDGWGEAEYEDEYEGYDDGEAANGDHFVGDGNTCACCGSYPEDCDCDESCEETFVSDSTQDDPDVTDKSGNAQYIRKIVPGDVFIDQDNRRYGRRLTVLSVAGDDILVQGESGLKRSVKADRLLSYKYKRQS